MDARVVGWGHTPFGIHKDKTLEHLIRDAALVCVFNMGGSGVANYCSVVETVR